MLTVQIRSMRVVPDGHREDGLEVPDRTSNERSVGDGGYEVLERDGWGHAAVLRLEESRVPVDRREAVGVVAHY